MTETQTFVGNVILNGNEYDTYVYGGAFVIAPYSQLTILNCNLDKCHQDSIVLAKYKQSDFQERYAELSGTFIFRKAVYYAKKM